MSIQQIKKYSDKITASSPNFFFDKKADKFREFSQAKIRHAGKHVIIKLTGDVFMLPREQTTEDWGQKYSMGVSFNESDCEVFDLILKAMEAKTSDGTLWDRKEAHDDGNIFLRLVPNSALNGWKFTSNVPFKPLKLENDKLEAGMEVTVEIEVQGWYRSAENINQYGTTLKVKDIWFGPPLKSKKRKTEDDEVCLYFQINN